MARLLTLLLISIAGQACAISDVSAPPDSPAAPRTLSYELVATHPHNEAAFTQGLLFDHDGYLIESSGNYGQSYISRQSLRDTAPAASYRLPDHLFAEGTALFGGRLYLLTWKAGRCLVLNANSLQPIDSLSYQGQGWGLTANKTELIMSNGGSNLYFRNPENFDLLRRVTVTDRGRPVHRLNELEWARGLVFANIWYSDTVVAIEPNSGEVRFKIDFSALRQREGRRADALNGIAFHAASGHFYLTGKYWSQLYEIKLPLPANP